MFRAMFSVDMKEKDASEIEVVDVSGETLAQMVQFMYTGRVTDLDERADELLGTGRRRRQKKGGGANHVRRVLQIIKNSSITCVSSSLLSGCRQIRVDEIAEHVRELFGEEFHRRHDRSHAGFVASALR